MLYGQLERPDDARQLIFLAHSHHTTNDVELSKALAVDGFAVFCVDLLTTQECSFVDATLNIPRLTHRLLEWIDFTKKIPELTALPVGLFALGDAAPAALRVAAQRDALIKAVVVYSGLIDRAGKQALELMSAPLLLIIEADGNEWVEQSSQRAAPFFSNTFKTISIEPPQGISQHASQWFQDHISAHEAINSARCKDGL